MKIDVKRIELIREALRALPPALKVRMEETKLEAVTTLAPQLLELRRKGYGLEALAVFLTEKGLPITAGTLKNYLQRAGATRGKRRQKTTDVMAGQRRDPAVPPPVSSGAPSWKTATKQDMEASVGPADQSPWRTDADTDDI